MPELLPSAAFRTFDLVKARKSASRVQPAAHQNAALDAVTKWFEGQGAPSAKNTGARGGIVVLPTGGGKTFTAVRFLCRGPLSQGFKVLWLAHTHHLLDQAFVAFAPRDDGASRGLEVGLIAEPRAGLGVRVVSGTPGHCHPHSIKASDDVVIATLQTMTRAVDNLPQLAGLRAWLKDAKNLVVVFDEAHHSPAPSYRELLATLRKSHPQLLLLGLTATPTYSDESKSGWLQKLFPQGILHQVSAKKLMLDGILARPIFESCTTQVVPEWDEREYQKWVGTYRDLPEEIVSHLARNSERNALIADTYAANRAKYGKTIIFAERWYQCEQIREFLQKRGVKAGAVYAHVESSASSVEERNRRDQGANARELEAFRSGELEVLINVRMLTEGTDVPDVQSVFLTRQTTSQILLTQMVGRALRGPKFGGTETAFIVSFHDNWGQAIQWADYELDGGPADEGDGDRPVPRPPLQLISIEMVRQLARATDRGGNVARGDFQSLVPVGWYANTFDSLPPKKDEDDEDDDIATVRDVVLVYDREKAAFEALIAFLKTQELGAFAGERVAPESVRNTLESWQKKFFGDDEERGREERLRALLDIARHMAQRAGSGQETAPPFVAFEERQFHDLDGMARQFIESDTGARAKMTALQLEYERGDRLWKVIYPSFPLFKSQYDAIENFILMGAALVPPPGTINQPERHEGREAPEEVKEQVKERDGWKCLCCGETHHLQVDHIASFYSGGNHALDNLQTLCRMCNGLKGINTMNFRLHCNRARLSPNAALANFPLPSKEDARDAQAWKEFLRRELNFFYECGAVRSVVIGGRGTSFYEWEIGLWEGNDIAWLAPHLKGLLARIQGRVRESRRDGFIMERLVVFNPQGQILAHPRKSLR